MLENKTNCVWLNLIKAGVTHTLMGPYLYVNCIYTFLREIKKHFQRSSHLFLLLLSPPSSKKTTTDEPVLWKNEEKEAPKQKGYSRSVKEPQSKGPINDEGRNYQKGVGSWPTTYYSILFGSMINLSSVYAMVGNLMATNEGNS